MVSVFYAHFLRDNYCETILIVWCGRENLLCCKISFAKRIAEFPEKFILPDVLSYGSILFVRLSVR